MRRLWFRVVRFIRRKPTLMEDQQWNAWQKRQGGPLSLQG